MSLASSSADIERPPPPLPRPWTGARIVGYLLVGLWILAGLGMVWFLVGSWDPEFFAKYLPWYADGLLTTIILVVISILLGAVISIPVAYARMSTSKFLQAVAYGYVYFFRGTPLLVQAFLVYYGFGAFRVELESIGLWWFFREAWYCAILAFTLNTSAYQAEILRGAIESVPRGQWEGAASLGLHRLPTMRKVILPQALIVALRPYGNEIILLIKGSAVVTLITVYDLMGMTRRVYSSSFDFQAYIWAAIIYMILVETLRYAVEWIERRITIHLHR
jgi:polar amino acid transport system permease protein